MEPASSSSAKCRFEDLLPGYSFANCELIGTGSSSVVVRVESLEAHQCKFSKFACKIQKLESATVPATGPSRRVFKFHPAFSPELVDMPRIPRARAEWEARNLADLTPGSTIGLRDWAMDDNFCLMVTEYAKGGTLETLRKDRGGKLDEAAARTVMQRLLKGLMNMHMHDISHRDIKLENLLVMNKDDVSSVKISDLGMAQQLVSPRRGDETHYYSVCGTPAYMAPEMLSSAVKNETTGRTEAAYGMKVDVWSCGVLLYSLLSGERPFISSNNDIGELFESIKEGRYDFDSPAWNGVSQRGKDFVCHLLTVDPKQRPSSAEALLHPWLSLERPGITTELTPRSKSLFTTPSFASQVITSSGPNKQSISKVMMATVLQPFWMRTRRKILAVNQAPDVRQAVGCH